MHFPIHISVVTSLDKTKTTTNISSIKNSRLDKNTYSNRETTRRQIKVIINTLGILLYSECNLLQQIYFIDYTYKLDFFDDIIRNEQRTNA